jgi:hypothetical protein
MYATTLYTRNLIGRVSHIEGLIRAAYATEHTTNVHGCNRTVMTPSWVVIAPWGFFFTPRSSNWNVACKYCRSVTAQSRYFDSMHFENYASNHGVLNSHANR